MIKSNFAELISILILELIELDEIEESIFIASTPVASWDQRNLVISNYDLRKKSARSYKRMIIHMNLKTFTEAIRNETIEK